MEVKPVELDDDFIKVDHLLEEMFKTIRENNVLSNDNLQFQLYDNFFEAMGILLSKYREGVVPLDQLLASKVLKKLLPLIDFFKSCYQYDAEAHIDFTFCLINILCVQYPQLFKSDYFKTIVKDFFEIEPLKNLFTITKLVTEDNLKLNHYFLGFLTVIFTRNFDLMMKIYNTDCK